MNERDESKRVQRIRGMRQCGNIVKYNIERNISELRNLTIENGE